MNEILTAQECADLLKVHIKTVYNLLSERRDPDKIFARKVGREWRIERKEVERFLSQELEPRTFTDSGREGE